MAGHSYKAAVDALDDVVTRDLDGPYRATVLEPVGKMCHYFNNVNAAIDKRNHKLIDYDASRSKVRKLVEKPSDDTAKLPRAQSEHDEAREIYDILNEQLIAELPQLVELRVREYTPTTQPRVRSARADKQRSSIRRSSPWSASRCASRRKGTRSWRACSGTLPTGSATSTPTASSTCRSRTCSPR